MRSSSHKELGLTAVASSLFILEVSFVYRFISLCFIDRDKMKLRKQQKADEEAERVKYVLL